MLGQYMARKMQKRGTAPGAELVDEFTRRRVSHEFVIHPANFIEQSLQLAHFLGSVQQIIGWVGDDVQKSRTTFACDGVLVFVWWRRYFLADTDQVSKIIILVGH